MSLYGVKFRLVAHKDSGLKAAPKILITELRGGMKKIGDRLKVSATSRMRVDRGESVESLVTEVRGSRLDLNVTVTSHMLRAFIDAYGLRPGTHVPYGFGSRLRTWAERKARGFDSKKTKGLADPYKGAGPHRRFGERPTTVRLRAKGQMVRKSRVTIQTAPLTGSVRTKAKARNASRIAYRAAQSIYLRGIKASHWNKRALEANKTLITREIKNAITRAAIKINRG
jgi:hypothetical protein